MALDDALEKKRAEARRPGRARRIGRRLQPGRGRDAGLSMLHGDLLGRARAPDAGEDGARRRRDRPPVHLRRARRARGGRARASSHDRPRPREGGPRRRCSPDNSRRVPRPVLRGWQDGRHPGPARHAPHGARARVRRPRQRHPRAHLRSRDDRHGPRPAGTAVREPPLPIVERWITIDERASEADDVLGERAGLVGRIALVRRALRPRGPLLPALHERHDRPAQGRDRSRTAW